MEQSGMSPRRALWFAVGLCALALAMLGVVLPLLPTTPFVLVAAFAFAQSSERWSRWLHEHRVFGPIVENWRRHGAISVRAKIVGVASMAAIFALSLALQVTQTVLVLQAVILTGAAAFVLSRPSPPKDP